jgi:hypothetical protein
LRGMLQGTDDAPVHGVPIEKLIRPMARGFDAGEPPWSFPVRTHRTADSRQM